MVEAAITLKDGRCALLRELRPEDAGALLALNRAVVEGGVGVVRSVEELDEREEAVRAAIARGIERSRGGAYACRPVVMLDGTMIGEGTAKRYALRSLSHVARLSVEVHPAHQGVGVGRAIMERMVAWVRGGRGSGVTRLELNVFADNTRAIRLYESLGFVCEGVHRAKLRRAEGGYRDDLTMALLLGDAAG